MSLRRSPMKRGKPLKQRSDRRSAERDAYEAAKFQAWSRDRGQCQAERKWPEIECKGRLDPHHIASQGQYPELRCAVDNLVVLCRAHHDAIHQDDPLRARQLGLLR